MYENFSSTGKSVFPCQPDQNFLSCLDVFYPPVRSSLYCFKKPELLFVLHIVLPLDNGIPDNANRSWYGFWHRSRFLEQGSREIQLFYRYKHGMDRNRI